MYKVKLKNNIYYKIIKEKKKYLSVLFEGAVLLEGAALYFNQTRCQYYSRAQHYFGAVLFEEIRVLHVYSLAKKSVPLLIFVKIGTKVDLNILHSMITFV